MENCSRKGLYKMRDTQIKKDNILVVDGTNLIFRNYFVHSYRNTKAGVNTGGLYGTIRSLQSYIKNFNPKQVFICFDKSGYTFRNEIYPSYKGNRKKTDIELVAQFSMLAQYCGLVNIPFIEIDMYEADDLIGSLCCNASTYDLNPYAVTGDRDILQLLHKGIDILYLSNNGPIIYNEDKFLDEYSINSSQYLDYKALVGDPSDNIPGVPGIGKKTAAKLLGLYEDLDGLYRNTDKLKGKQKEKILENKSKAYLFKEILTIKCDLDLDYDDYFIRYIDEGYSLNNHRVVDFLRELEIEGI